MNREEKEKKKQTDKFMARYNIFRVVVILGLLVVMYIAAISNGTNTEEDEGTKNPNEVTQEDSYYNRFKKDYESFKGETVDFSKINIGELVVNDDGYNLYPYKSINEVYLAFSNVRNEYSFENEYMNIEQNRGYDGFTGVINSSNVIKTYKCKKDKESLEVYAESLGNVGNSCNKMVITIRGEGWDRVEDITTSFLKELQISDEMIEAINKSETINGTQINYTNSEDSVTIAITKKVSGVCELVLNIYNNTDGKNINTINNVNYESVEGMVKLPNLIKSDKSNDLSFENTDKLFGKVLEDMFYVRLKEELVSCDVNVKTYGAKMANGYILSETDEFNSLYKSESGKYTLNLVGTYTEGSANITLTINKTTDEKITDEERDNIRAVLHEFTTYVDEGNDIDYYALKESDDKESNIIHFSVTDSTGNVVTVAYSYDSNESSISLTKSHSVLSERTESFDTYK